MKKTLLSIFLIALGLTINAQTIYVNINATGANNGTSWGNAYLSLRTALLNASTNSTIWVASGTYKPYVSSRSDYFNINIGGLKIYGGFAGNETSLTQRVFGSNETILSGDASGNDSGTPTYTNSSYTDNCYNVMVVSGAGNDLTLDRLTITGGFANGSSGTTTDGAGIYFGTNIARFTMQNCKVSKNVSKQGGAISAPLMNPSVGDTLTINACEFSENLSGFGAGIYASADFSATTINISNCLFTKNTAKNTSGTNGYAGSSIWIAGYATGSTITTNIANCTFAKNTDEGTYSGMANNNRSTVVLSKAFSSSLHYTNISSCIFWDNTNPGGVAPSISKANDNFFASTFLLLQSSDQNNFAGLVPSAGSAGNNNLDPLFVNSAGGNFQLSASSPAINTGDNSKVVGSNDVFNNQRIFNSTVDRGAIEFGSSPTGINDLNTLNNITFYPNPATSIIHIQTEGTILTMSIYNTLGDLVQQENVNTFSIEQLSTGIYMLQVKTEKGTGTIRFVKE